MIGENNNSKQIEEFVSAAGFYKAPGMARSQISGLCRARLQFRRNYVVPLQSPRNNTVRIQAGMDTYIYT